MKSGASAASAESNSPSGKVPHVSVGSDFVELVKARLTALVLLTTAVGYYLGAAPPIHYVSLLNVFCGTAAAAGGAAALNQWWEWQSDALMQRTKMRPVPAGR